MPEVIQELIAWLQARVDAWTPPDRTHQACEPPDACATTGRCWTHSEWADGPDHNQVQTELRAIIQALQDDTWRKKASGTLASATPTGIIDGCPHRNIIRGDEYVPDRCFDCYMTLWTRP